MQSKIVGVVGVAGAGKDTVVHLALQEVDGYRLSFAAPLKEFAGEVFGFTNRQLYGPSEARNAPDRYLSRCSRRGTIPGLYDELEPQGLVDRLLRRPHERQLSNVGPAHVHNSLVDSYRGWCWLNFHDEALPWLQKVLPKGFSLAEGYLKLTAWMTEMMAQEVISPRAVLQKLGTEWGREQIHQDIWIDAGLREALALSKEDVWVFITDVRFLSEAQRLTKNGAALWMVSRPGHDSGVPAHKSELDQGSDEMRALITDHIVNDSTLHMLQARVHTALMR